MPVKQRSHRELVGKQEGSASETLALRNHYHPDKKSCKGMHNENHSSSEMPDLNELLKSWEVPEAPNSLNRRVLSDYRQHVNRVPFWKKIFTSSVQIPMPLVLAQAALLLVAGAFLFSLFVKQKPATTPAVVAEIPKAQIIEVPVVQEKIITKIIYTNIKSKPQIRYVAAPPMHAEEVTVNAEVASNLPVATPEVNRLITPNLRPIRSIQIPELPAPKQNFAETAYLSDSPYAVLARNNFDLPATIFARQEEPSSPMKFGKLAATTGFMMKLIDNKSTRMVYRFGGRTKTFAQEAILDRILFRPRVDPNWNAAFGDACAPH